MSEHHKGRLILGGCSGRMITTPNGYTGDGFLADVDTLANARRLVACWNACEGIPTEVLEGPDSASVCAMNRALADAVLVPKALMRFVRKVWLPHNPNKLRAAAPETIQAAKDFIAIADAAQAKHSPTPSQTTVQEGK